MLTQIYEVATPDEAAAISAVGVDHVGILVGDGSFPRELSLAQAQCVAEAVTQSAKISALFLSADLELIANLARALAPDIVHLGAASDRLLPTDVRRLRTCVPAAAIMRSIPVTGPEAMDIAASYEDVVDYLLLDSHRTGDVQIGALGVTHDWSVSADIVKRVRTCAILAGGLGPANVGDAIRAVRPAGVDSKTLTDHPGHHTKDLGRVAAFHAAAKATARKPTAGR